MRSSGKCNERANPTVFQKTLGLNDFYYRDETWDFPLGHIQMLGKSDGQLLRAGAPKFVPPPVLDLVAKHAVDFWSEAAGHGRIV